MKISIVMATCNGEKYIVEQMDSLRAQTRHADEVLIFDDCSSDSTVGIISAYIEEYGLKTWKLIINEQNKGWQKNFVDGLIQATGDLIFPCDQDDIWMPEKLAEMEAVMKAHPEVGLLISSRLDVKDGGGKERLVGPNNGSLTFYQLGKAVYLGKKEGCALCFRASCIAWYTKYWHEEFPHDSLLWCLSALNDSRYHYGKALICHRIHEKSATAVERKRKRQASSCRYMQLVCLKKLHLCMMQFLANENCADKATKKEILDEWASFLNRRAHLAETRKLSAALRLLADLKYYETCRQYLGDVFCFVLPEWLQRPLRRFV